MRVVVDHAWYDGPPSQIDPFCVWSRKGRYLLIAAHRQEAVTFDGNRLSDREALIDANDFAVRQNQIRRALLQKKQAGNDSFRK